MNQSICKVSLSLSLCSGCILPSFPPSFLAHHESNPSHESIIPSPMIVPIHPSLFNPYSIFIQGEEGDGSIGRLHGDCTETAQANTHT